MRAARRDVNLARVRNWTGAIAGASLVATGLFAGLASTRATVTRTIVVTKTKVVRTLASSSAGKATTTTASAKPAAAPTVTVTQSAPVASSGGS